jgi:neugrin
MAQFSEDFLDNDPDTMESLEPDFMNVHEAHKQFEQEEQRFRETVPRFIVGRKYFKTNGANFLTWSEKEQIRNLHEQNETEWTPDKLSQSFPADPATISKLIRNRWHPRDEMRVYKHDESVMKNWESFKRGELEVEPVLEQHLQKFAQRDFKSLRKPTTNKKLGVEIPKPVSTEFSNIIKSCKKYADKEQPEQKNLLQLGSNAPKFPDQRPKNRDQDSVLLTGIKKTTMKGMTLSEFQKYSPDIVSKDDVEPVFARDALSFKSVKNVEKDLTTLEIDSKLYERLRIEDHIEIPRQFWKRDQTYKVGDCFYDDDGEFLYRVPGLK